MKSDLLKLVGRYDYTVRRNGIIVAKGNIKNGITDEGKNKLLDVMFHGVTAIGTWYIGLISNSGYSAVAAGDTHASHAGWTEFTDYDEATRVAWPEDAAASKAISNSVAAEFNFNATGSVRGIFLASVSTKGSTSAGTLWNTALFPAAQPVVSGDNVDITYTLTVA